MNISEAAQRSGLSSKTIRYYEQIELIQPAKRSDNGYRDYSAHDLEVLQFLQRSRATGFGLDECRQLLELYQNPQRRSQHVKSLVEEKLGQVDRQIQELQAMRDTLATMVSHCAGDEGPVCAIIDELAHPDSVVTERTKSRVAGGTSDE